MIGTLIYYMLEVKLVFTISNKIKPIFYSILNNIGLFKVR